MNCQGSQQFRALVALSGPRFDSQHPQPFITPVPGIPFDLCGLQAHIYIQAKHPNTQKLEKNEI